MASINGILQIGLGSLGLLPYALDIGSESAYLGLGGREGSPVHPCLVLVPLQILPQICNILDETSNGLGTSVALYPPYLSHYPLGIEYLTYD